MNWLGNKWKEAASAIKKLPSTMYREMQPSALLTRIKRSTPYQAVQNCDYLMLASMAAHSAAACTIPQIGWMPTLVVGTCALPLYSVISKCIRIAPEIYLPLMEKIAAEIKLHGKKKAMWTLVQALALEGVGTAAILTLKPSAALLNALKQYYYYDTGKLAVKALRADKEKKKE